MQAFRIADGRHPIFDGTGAMLHGGRWNSAGRPVIYAAETYSGAMLEVLVHANLPVPPRHHQVVEITVPDNLHVETLPASALPHWNTQDLSAARAFGDAWLREGRSAVLRVPGVVTAGREFNVLINPLHPDAHRVQASRPVPVEWDVRLFARP